MSNFSLNYSRQSFISQVLLVQVPTVFLNMPRHNEFSNQDMRDMICIYAQCNYVSRAASRRYLELYHIRRQPHHTIFQRIFQRLGETGEFRPKRRIGRPKQVTVEQEEEILVRVAENSQISTRRLQAATGISKTTILKVIHDENLYPYHFTPVQNLLPTDLPARLNFCNFLNQKQDLDPDFPKKILFTDEATFTRRGVFNWRNNHSWEQENPHAIRERHFQHEFSINIWCGIVGNFIIGPYELPARLNGNEYLRFLENDLPGMLEDVPLLIRQNIWYMHDGAPAHYSIQVRNFLNQNFPNRWIGRGSEFAWPPRSPDLNPMDFYFWGHLKDLVYKQESATREDLLQKIRDGVNTIRNKDDILFRVRGYLNKAIQKCIEQNGGHFAQYLK